MNEAKIKEIIEQVSTAILNGLMDRLEAEKNKAAEKKEPSIEDRWKPEITDKYFPVSGGSDVIDCCGWNDDGVDNQYYKNYNTWKSIGRAEEVFNKTKLLWLIEQIHDILCPDYKPDWKNDDEKKYSITFSFIDKMWLSEYYYYKSEAFTFFDTEKHAQQACDILNDMGVKPY